MGARSGPMGAVVLGMHRSGTSAVAGFLARAGFFAGDSSDLLAPAEDNPRGFFERTDVNELNDGILADLGGYWDNPPPREAVVAKAPSYAAEVADILARLEGQAAGRPLVVKDPRVSLLLPAWLPSLDERFAIVLVDRPPLEVALSVRKRDGRPLSVALALWQLYCTELAHGLAGRRVIVVRYQDFVAGPDARGPWLVDQVLQALPPDKAASISAGLGAGFISPDMRHHRAQAAQDETQALTLSQAALARWFSDLPEGWCDLPAPGQLGDQPQLALTEVSEYYHAMGDRHGMEIAYDRERHRALHFEQATELKDRHIANLEGALSPLQALVESQRERLEELEARCAALEEDNQALRQQLHRLREDGRAAAANLFSVARRNFPRTGS